MHFQVSRSSLFAGMFACLALVEGHSGVNVLSAQQSTSVSPGEDLAALVQSFPSGTTFRLSAGTYRLLQIQPKTGDVFVGVGHSTVLSGATLITSIARHGAFYSAPYTTPQGQLNGSCLATNPMCQFPEDLFFDNKPLLRVASASQVSAGKWFLDYAHQQIVFSDNPSGHTVEISTARSAFSGPASNVLIESLDVEKYAVPAQMGAIGDQYPGPGWKVIGCQVRWNHGTGIHVVDQSRVGGNIVFQNGQLGIAAEGTNIAIQNNQVSFNNFAGYDPGWEAGGVKIALATSVLLRGNNVHDNNGAGLWADIESSNITYDSNTVTNNTGAGIQHEISYSALIQNNTVSGNGSGSSAWLWGSQILVQNSQGVTVRNNKVTVPAAYGNGIGIVNQNRGLDSKSKPYIAQNNYVHGNDVTYLGSSQGSSGVAVDYDPEAVFNSTNRFDYNHYHVTAANSYQWAWSGPQTWTGFQGSGQEIHGTMDTNH